jgi:hypothetical protein
VVQLPVRLLAIVVNRQDVVLLWVVLSVEPGKVERAVKLISASMMPVWLVVNKRDRKLGCVFNH